jgi:hypothetical protein
LTAANKGRWVCPLCHACLHLDIAGRMRAGKIIWLPELTQEELNILCLASFLAMRKAGVNRKHAETQAMCDQIARLYKTFDRRAEAVEGFLGEDQALFARQTLSSPGYIASLIVSAQRESKLSPRIVAQRVEGLRLLPAPEAFEAYIGKVSRLVDTQFPVKSWMGRVASDLAKLDAAQTGQGDESFDASPAQGLEQ